MSEDEHLLAEAKRSREETEKAREGRESDAVPPDTDPSPGEPWAKTSSGDADSVTTDDD